MKKIIILGICILMFLISFGSATALSTTNMEEYWSLDNDNTTGTDCFGYTGKLNGTLTNGLTSGVTGKSDEAYSFDGTTQTINMGNLNSIVDESNDFSISFWAKFDENDTNEGLFAYFTSSNPYLRLYRMTNNSLIYHSAVGDGCTNFKGITSTPVYADGWHHFVTTYDSDDNAVLYVDGVVLLNVTTDNSCDSMDTQDFQFGSIGTANYYLKGDMDEISLWSEELVQDNVTELYNSGAGDFYPFSAPASQNISVNWTYPTNDSQFNTFQLDFNFTLNITNTSNLADCTLSDDDGVNQTLTGLNNTGTHTFTVNYSVGTEKGFNYTIFCENIDANYTTDKRYILIDAVFPYISLTNNTYWTLEYSPNITAQDENLYSFMYNDSCSNDYYNNSLTGLTTFNYNPTYDVSSCELGEQHTNITVCDGHTAKEIGTFDTEKDINKKELKYNFDREYISIYPDSPEDFIGFDTDKLLDRYTFDYDLNIADKNKEYIFYVKSTQPIDIIEESKYKAHLVIPALNKWVDFETVDSDELDYKVKQISKNLVEVSIKGFKDKKIKFNSVGSLNCRNATYTWFNMARVNITANSSVTGAGINDFDIYLDGAYHGNTATGLYQITNLTTGTYNITIDNPLFELKSTQIEINSTENDNLYNFNLYDTNSLNITIRDEVTGNILTDNITIRFTNNVTEWSNNTVTGYFYIGNLDATEYEIFFSSNNTDYDSRSYILDITNRTYTQFTAYLPENSSQTVFTVYDKYTAESIENALVAMYRLINSSWTAVESKTTDITGQARLSYMPDVKYKFLVSKTGYENLLFYLNPILESQYTIKMTPSQTLESYQDYDKVAVYYEPQSFQAGANSFSFIIQSPDGDLIDYGYTLTYPTGTNTTGGTNSLGEELDINFIITNPSWTDTVNLTFYYNTLETGNRSYTRTFPISVENGTGTILQTGETYGMGLFERVFLATLILIFITGISALMGQSILGFGVGLIVTGLLVFSGFVPIWAFAITFIMGVLLLTWFR